MGLFIAAAITTALVLCGFAILLRQSDDWRPMALAFLIALPLQPLMIYALRLPVDGLLRTTFGISATWVTIVALFYAPLTEEPAKWLTAAVPKVRQAIFKDPILLALAAGAGFGLGEVWFLAHALIRSPSYPDLPFYMFDGFLFERLAVCFLHGVLLVPPFYALASGRSFLLGGLAGMALHFLLNLPIYLASINLFGLGETWKPLLLLWIAVLVVLGAILVLALPRRPTRAARFKARRRRHRARRRAASSPPSRWSGRRGELAEMRVAAGAGHDLHLIDRRLEEARQALGRGLDLEARDRGEASAWRCRPDNCWYGRRACRCSRSPGSPNWRSRPRRRRAPAPWRNRRACAGRR